MRTFLVNDYFRKAIVNFIVHALVYYELSCKNSVITNVFIPRFLFFFTYTYMYNKLKEWKLFQGPVLFILNRVYCMPSKCFL